MVSLWQTHQAHALSIYCPTLCVVQIPRNPSALPDEQFDSTLSSVIDSTLGLRCRSLGYQYSEIIRSLMSIYFCGGSCIEDVTTHLMNHLSLHPTLHTCSSDTILRAIKELTQENISYTSDTGKNYDFLGTWSAISSETIDSEPVLFKSSDHSWVSTSVVAQVLRMTLLIWWTISRFIRHSILVVPILSSER